MMRKLFAKLHLWLSIPCGLVLTVICLTGTSLVFEREITQGLQPELYRVVPPAADARPLPPSELVARVLRQTGDTLRIASVEWSGDPQRTCMVTFRETGRRTLSVDPYTGEVNGWTRSYGFFRTMRQLHRWLLDPPASKGEMSVGKAVVGWSTLLMVVILVSGLVIWFPRNRAAWKHRLRVSTRKGWRRFWYDSHVALGFYATLLLLVMALTGLTWSFGWYRTAAYGLIGGGRPATAVAGAGGTAAPASSHATKGEGAKTASEAVQRQAERTNVTAALPGENGNTDAALDPQAWDRVMEQLQERYPVYRTMTLSDGEVQVAPRPHSYMRRVDRVVFDPASGAIRSLVRADEQPRDQQLRGWFYALHTGTWGGLTVKILWSLAALIGGTLPLTGYYLWLRRRRRRARTGQTGQAVSR